MPAPQSFDARLVRRRTLSPSVRELGFERADGAPFVFEPGQWVSLVLPLPEGEVRRAYSIASPPASEPCFELAVTHVRGGPGSTYLHTLAAGAELRAIGPQGFFTRPADGPPSLMVATGTGLAPIRSMIRAAVAARSRSPMWLLFGVREEADILWRDELERLAETEPSMRVEVTLSRPGPGWRGRSGYVQTHVRELWAELTALGAGPPHAFVCGLEKMVGAVRDVLRKDLGVVRQQVHSERYD